MTYEVYLVHHGIKGQRWGVRRYQNEDGSLTLAGRKRYAKEDRELKDIENAQVHNMDKWGKSPEMNVLYITGYSGSGKTTIADRLAKQKGVEKPIYLDVYTSQSLASESKAVSLENGSFSKYLDRKIPGWRDKVDLDKLSKVIDEYGKDAYSRGNRVIVEGMQIFQMGRPLREDFSFYKNRPVIVPSTNAAESMSRMLNRNSQTNIFKKAFQDPIDLKKDIQWYLNQFKDLSSFKKEVQVKRGSVWLDDYLKKYGQRKA